jgi:hypothetical protein
MFVFVGGSYTAADLIPHILTFSRSEVHDFDLWWRAYVSRLPPLLNPNTTYNPNSTATFRPRTDLTISTSALSSTNPNGLINTNMQSSPGIGITSTLNPPSNSPLPNEPNMLQMWMNMGNTTTKQLFI